MKKLLYIGIAILVFIALTGQMSVTVGGSGGVVFSNPLHSDTYTISSPYGMRTHPISGELKMHTGIDLADEEGTNVYPALPGIVEYTGFDDGYGNQITIKHASNYITKYAHLKDINVIVGQSVSNTDVIGTVGNTGISTGPHLHFEVIHNTDRKNPTNYIEF
ncbi:M23 family metallopeptidase [Wukongibacter baidiensis]|uniref:M23 family metallopeptidase n=1 Tax=Wukongibacter baidiensis TaxID=1723361 RepID=UPI003D7F9BE9